MGQILITLVFICFKTIFLGLYIISTQIPVKRNYLPQSIVHQQIIKIYSTTKHPFEARNLPNNIQSISNNLLHLLSINLPNKSMSTRQPTYQSYSSTSRSLTPAQNSLNLLLKGIKDQLLQNNIIQSQTELQNIFSVSQKNEYQDAYYIQNLSNAFNHLIAVILEEREHNDGLLQQLNQNIEENDKKILQGLEIFVDLTQRMADFSKDVFKERSEERALPVEICRHFRQVYEMTQELSNIFNDYGMENEQFLSRRDELIALQIRCMEGVLIDEENEIQSQIQPQKNESLPRASRNSTNQQTEDYILSLRQQISHLHQTLLKNDQQFTIQIQNYNKTLREMSATIKAYELEFAKITNYELKIEDLEKMVVRLREEKYRNDIVIENMAKKIRNFEKELRGDKAFLSPQRQRLVSSPESKFSMLNSKLTSTLSVVNSINNSTGNLMSPVKKTLF